MINILKSKDNQFYFTVTAKNNKVLVTSEMYTRKESAVKSARALHKSLTGYFIKGFDHTNGYTINFTI